MAPEEGPPSRPARGVASFGGKTVHLWDQFKKVRVGSSEPQHIGYKQACSPRLVEGEASELPDFEPVSADAQAFPSPPDDKAICGNCLRKWSAARLFAISGEEDKDEAAERAFQEVIATLTKVSRVMGEPAQWTLRFGDRVYKADGEELFDLARFERWWFNEFLATLPMTHGHWRKVLDKVGQIANEIPEDAREEEGANDMTLAREQAIELLSTYRICEDPRDIGTAVFRGALNANGKTWVPAGEIVGHLQKHGFKLGPPAVREALRGIVTGGSKMFRFGQVTKRCWPIDAKAAGIDLIVLPPTQPNGEKLDPTQATLHAEENT